MPDQVADVVDDSAPEGDAPAAAAAEPEGLSEADIATWRKRQAGADAARAAAEKERDEYRKRVEAYEAREREAQNANLTAEAQLQAKLEAAERRAAEAEERANARILDAQYPNARKELPEVTDPVRLAKFEAMLKDDDQPAEATTRSMRAPRNGSPSTPAKEKSSADYLAELKAMPPGSWLGES